MFWIASAMSHYECSFVDERPMRPRSGTKKLQHRNRIGGRENRPFEMVHGAPPLNAHSCYSCGMHNPRMQQTCWRCLRSLV